MIIAQKLQEILEHADELGRRFEEHEPTDVRDAAPLHAIREAVTERAAAERRVAELSRRLAKPACPGPQSAARLEPPARPARKRYRGQHVRSGVERAGQLSPTPRASD